MGKLRVRGAVRIGLLLLLASCRPIVDSRGYTTDAEDFKQIVIGQSRSEDVAAVLGTPTTRSSFGDEIWYYISLRRETQGLFAPQIADQQVTAIHFDADHVVKQVETRTKADAKNVQVVDTVTPTEGRHLTIMEQLLGNLGRFSAPGRQVDPRNLGR